jgi:hypothetical protein
MAGGGWRRPRPAARSRKMETDMPIKGQKPREVVRTEMRKFSEGKLHTGSPKGKIVTDRKQAGIVFLSAMALVAFAGPRGIRRGR